MSSNVTRRTTRWTVIGTVVVAVVSLTSCESGEPAGVTRISDIAATLHGEVRSSDPTPRFWFEYDHSPTVVDGQLTFASSTPQDEWACCGPMLAASKTVTDLIPDTTYHYRFCIRNESGGGRCGATDTFTTRPADRDVVEGTLSIPIYPELGAYDGVSVSVRAEPDSSLPVGSASRIPGSYYFRFPDSGDVTCLRISGNRAAVGFAADDETGAGNPPVNQVVFVEDNGPSGDRFGHELVSTAPLTCPDPGTTDVTWKVATQGDVTITDHAPAG